MVTELTLGFTAEGSQLFEAFKASKYMKSVGYGILYATVYRTEETVASDLGGGIQAATTGSTGTAEEYSMCFSKYDPPRFIHMRIPAGPTPKMVFFSTIGPDAGVMDTVVNLVKEARATLV